MLIYVVVLACPKYSKCTPVHLRSSVSACLPNYLGLTNED